MKLVTFGVTGDLMRLKILPSLYELHRKRTLPSLTNIVGISRRSWNDTELRAYIKELVPEAEHSFLSLFTFLQGDAEDLATFTMLARVLASDDALLYFSLAPTLYQKVFTNMQKANFKERRDMTRVLIEKPFGTSGASASELYALIQRVVPEKDIYLVDHYLAKEWVQRLHTLPAMSEHMAQIHVRLFESVGAEQRGALYDTLGALRDVGQNHVLQIVAHLIASHDRARALEQLPILSPAQVASATVRAQYQDYQAIPGVAPKSQTETYFMIRTTLEIPPFMGVELVLEAGKSLPRNCKEIVLKRKDGSLITIAEQKSDVGEYEILLEAAVRGDKTFFPSIREVLAQWRFIDPIATTWATGTPKLLTYLPGTMPRDS